MTTTNIATPLQVRLARELLVERDLAAEVRPDWRERLFVLAANPSLVGVKGFNATAVLIDTLFALPEVTEEMVAAREAFLARSERAEAAARKARALIKGQRYADAI